MRHFYFKEIARTSRGFQPPDGAAAGVSQKTSPAPVTRLEAFKVELGRLRSRRGAGNCRTPSP
jgi:hypothetical protein